MRARTILLFGAPGAGKGTIEEMAKRIEEALGG
jgi:adenylate kinase family enzyme